MSNRMRVAPPSAEESGSQSVTRAILEGVSARLSCYP
jgi:hypothetical protein